MSKEAMKLALEVLRKTNGIVWANEENTNIALECDAVIKDLEEALAKQEQNEPVVRYFEQWQASPLEEVDEERFNKLPEAVRFKLYEAPQQHKLLTDA